MLRLLAIRDARLFLAGQTLSLFGDTALYLALGIWVKTLTGSNAAAGLVFFALALPALVAPAAGLLVDRVRRRPLMIATDLLIGVAVLLLFFVHGRDQLWLIYAVTLLYGAAGIVFNSAQSALLTTMLPDELLGEGNAALQTVREALRIVGPLTGATLFAAFGGGVVAAIDALTFGASALCLAALRTPEAIIPRERESGGEQALLTELAAGARHIMRTAALRRIVLTVAVALLVVGFSETIIFAVAGQGLRRPPSFLGVLSAVQGMGAIVGGLTAATALRKLGDARAIALGLALFALGDGLLVRQELAVVLLGIVIAGAGLPWIVVGFGTALQRRTPAHLQGRVYSAADTMVSTPQTVSIALGAGLSAIVDYRILVAIMAVVVAAGAAYLYIRQAAPDSLRATEIATESAGDVTGVRAAVATTER